MEASPSCKLSVVITTYKRAAQLDRTLESLSRQTRQPDELIVSDDCSPDHTAEVAGRWKDRFRNFVYSRNERNLYMPGNLNAGISRAHGAYIANLHDADTFDPGLLEKWEAALDAHPTAGFVFCGCENLHGDPEKPRDIRVADIPPLTPGRQFFLGHYVGGLSGPVWGTVMARSSAYEALGEFDAAFGFVSDVDMWMRMCGRFDVAYVHEPLLLLDMETTDQRKFDWGKAVVHDRMVVANIRRIFRDDPVLLGTCLRRQRRAFRRRFFWLMGTRIYRRDPQRIWEGLRLFRHLWLTPPTTDLPSDCVKKRHPPSGR